MLAHSHKHCLKPVQLFKEKMSEIMTLKLKVLDGDVFATR